MNEWNEWTKNQDGKKIYELINKIANKWVGTLTRKTFHI